MSEKILNRLLELLQEDRELHNAVVEAIRGLAEAEKARAKWYDRRNRNP